MLSSCSLTENKFDHISKNFEKDWRWLKPTLRGQINKINKIFDRKQMELKLLSLLTLSILMLTVKCLKSFFFWVPKTWRKWKMRSLQGKNDFVAERNRAVSKLFLNGIARFYFHLFSIFLFLVLSGAYVNNSEYWKLLIILPV